MVEGRHRQLGQAWAFIADVQERRHGRHLGLRRRPLERPVDAILTMAKDWLRRT